MSDPSMDERTPVFRLWVGRLDSRLTVADVTYLFEHFGPMYEPVELRVDHDYPDGAEATLTFLHEADALSALQMDGLQVVDDEIIVCWYDERPEWALFTEL